MLENEIELRRMGLWNGRVTRECSSFLLLMEGE